MHRSLRHPLAHQRDQFQAPPFVAQILVRADVQASTCPRLYHGIHIFLVGKEALAAKERKPLGRHQAREHADGCEASSYALYSSQNQGLGFYVYDGSTWKRSPEADPSVWDGRWHHAAGTYDGSMLRLFIDGVEVGTGTPASLEIEYDLPTTESMLGTYPGGCSFQLIGDVDGVSVWNRALPIPDIARVVRAFVAGR